MRLVTTCLLLLACGCGRIDFERMKEQPRKDAYEAADLFADGKVLQHPPVGTVHRQQVVGPASLVDGLANGRYVGKLPVAVDRRLLARGRNRYDRFCAVCHGSAGYAQTEVARQMRLRPPPSFHDEKLRAYPPGRIYQVITLGYGLMPSYAARLGIRDRWAVVAYVQLLQLSQRVNLERLTPRMRKEAQKWLK